MESNLSQFQEPAMKRTFGVAIILGAAVLGGLGGLAIAGPMLATKGRTPHKYRSLAGLEKIRLVVDVPSAVVDLGVVPADVAKRCRTIVGKAGMLVVDDADAAAADEDVEIADVDVAVMRLRVLHLTDPGVKDACAFSVQLSFSEPVIVPRIGETLEIETFKTQALGIDHIDEAGATIDATMTEMVARIVRKVTDATRRWEEEKRNER